MTYESGLFYSTESLLYLYIKGMYALGCMVQLRSRIFMLTDIEMILGDKIDLHECFKFLKKKFRNTVHRYEIL